MEQREQVATGLILVQGACLPQQIRHFLESNQVYDHPNATSDLQETIQFHVLPAISVPTALQQVRLQDDQKL